MSSEEYTDKCPRCGGDFLYWADKVPYEHMRRHCVDCGLYERADTGLLTLEEVNKLREANGYEPLKALKEPRPGYDDWAACG